MNRTNQKQKMTDIYIIYPQWAALFFIGGGLIILPIGIFVLFVFGLSSASDMVFSIEAMISGFLLDFILKSKFNKKLVFAPKLEIPFIYIWFLLCLFVFIARPFEK